MIAALHRAVAAPSLSRRLGELVEGAAPSSLVSLTIDLAPGYSNWLPLIPTAGPYWYWAQPHLDDWRLGLGDALHYDTDGNERFAALDHAFAGMRRHWRRDGGAAVFFGFAFDPQQQGAMPNTRLQLPALLLHCRQGRCQATLSCVAGHAAKAVDHWLALLHAPTTRPANSAFRQLPQDLEEQAWQARVQSALRDIATGELDKVVLGRSIRLVADGPFNAASVLAALLLRQTDCTVFAVGCDSQAFIGASPERLVRLQAGEVEADALAGTTWLGDAGRAAPLRLDGDKNSREQGFVVAGMRTALGKLCTRLDQGEAPEVLHLRQVSHLRTRLYGKVREGTTLFDLAAALHPTPAIGGCPGPAALAWLCRHGEQRPDWYSGGIGWLDTNGDGEIAVALRCASINGREARLSAGAGIVAGSEPRQELAETEAKLQVMLEALRHPAPLHNLPPEERTGTR